MAIFGTAPGTVGQVVTIPGQSLPAMIKVGGLTGTVALTSIGFSQDANVQFMHSLGRVIYVYSFGERMGVVEVNGVTFFRPCASDGSAGLSSVFSWYKKNSISAGNNLTSVTLADTNIRGFVRGIRSTASDPGKGVVGFSILLATLPEIWGE